VGDPPEPFPGERAPGITHKENMMNTTREPIALYCTELQHLMTDSGRTFRVPDPIAATVGKKDPDTRFVKSWAVMHGLIPREAEVAVFLETLEEAA